MPVLAASSEPTSIRLSTTKKKLITAGLITAGTAGGLFLANYYNGFNAWYIWPMIWCLFLVFAGLAFHIEVSGKWKTAAQIIVALGSIFFSYLMLEMWLGNNFAVPFDGQNMMKIRWALNFGVLLGFYLFLQGVFGSLKKSLSIGSIILCAVGVTCYIVLQFRGDTFLPTDILAAGTAMAVVANYKLVLYSNVWSALLMFVTIKIYTNKLPDSPKTGNRLMTRTIALLCSFLIFWSFFTFKSEKAYYPWFIPNNGYAFTFLMNIKLTHVSAPDGYDAKQAEAIVAQGSGSSILSKTYNAKQAITSAFPEYVARTGSADPNIFVIMNESFADLNVVGDVPTTTELMPNISAMKENTIKGHLYVEVFGGGTADTEYTFLTGNSTKLFAENARAYQLYVNENTPALPKNLKNQGYNTVALHPDKETNWNRNIAYPYLGFEDFQDIQTFGDAETNRDGYTTDRATYQRIESLYENKDDAPLFVFDVTMQNHGSYTQSYTGLEQVDLEGDYPLTQQYLSLVKSSDAQFAEMIDYFKTADEPVVICMFGDHQPKLEDAFYNMLAGGIDKKEWTLAQQQNQQITPFVIWANYEIPEQEIERMSVNYLSTLLTETAGTTATPYNDYLAWLYKQMPVITRKGVITQNGDILGYNELDANQEKLIADYDIVVYNDLLDKKSPNTSLYNVPATK